MAPKSSSFPGLVHYPTNRDIWAKSSVNWLEGRRQDDGAEGLWRIHDHLYDFSTFIDAHPGGPDWLQLTKVSRISVIAKINQIFKSEKNNMHCEKWIFTIGCKFGEVDSQGCGQI